MRLPKYWKPGEILPDDIGHSEKPQEEGRHLGGRCSGSKVSKNRNGGEEDIDRGVHRVCSLPLPRCDRIATIRASMPETHEESDRDQNESYDADRLVQLVEEKLREQMPERHNNHQPPDRAPEQNERGGPPMQFALRLHPIGRSFNSHGPPLLP